MLSGIVSNVLFEYRKILFSELADNNVRLRNEQEITAFISADYIDVSLFFYRTCPLQHNG